MAGDVLNWKPPGKNCGLCGTRNCASFSLLLQAGDRTPEDCPFYEDPAPAAENEVPVLPGEGAFTANPAKSVDNLGHGWDFILSPLPEEPSARKIVLPFRPDLVEKWQIVKGDIVVGRPFGAGCPVQHVLQVIKADPVTGVLETWVVGPRFARGREVKDVVAYHMLGFEGLAADLRRPPVFGARHTFLPGFCMMHLNHTGLVNMLLKKEAGLQVRLEDIRILAGPPG